MTDQPRAADNPNIREARHEANKLRNSPWCTDRTRRVVARLALELDTLVLRYDHDRRDSRDHRGKEAPADTVTLTRDQADALFLGFADLMGADVLDEAKRQRVCDSLAKLMEVTGIDGSPTVATPGDPVPADTLPVEVELTVRAGFDQAVRVTSVTRTSGSPYRAAQAAAQAAADDVKKRLMRTEMHTERS